VNFVAFVIFVNRRRLVYRDSEGRRTVRCAARFTATLQRAVFPRAED
jgi:hypothetical protein